MFAKTEKAARRLSAHFRRESPNTANPPLIKKYMAVVKGTPNGAHGQMSHMLQHKKDVSRAAKVRIAGLNDDTLGIKEENRRGGEYCSREARLSWRVAARSGGFTLLEIDLHTGRRHQIRAQLSFEGYIVVFSSNYVQSLPVTSAFSPGLPIVGDSLYSVNDGSRVFSSFLSKRAIALHSAVLGFPHPIEGKPYAVFSASVPEVWSTAFGVPFTDLANEHIKNISKAIGS